MNTAPGRLLGIDHGRQVIGLAVSDTSGLLASPLRILYRQSKVQDFAEINRILTAEDAVEIIVGLPHIPTDTSKHSQADSVRIWASRLAAAVSVPVRLWDETMSSAEARQIGKEKGRAANDRIDDLAAAIILQSYLDGLREGFEPPPVVKPAGESS